MMEIAKATGNNIDFMTAFKAAILESLCEKNLITVAEKTALKQENLSQNLLRLSLD